jgi:hypothetical protein
MNIVKTTAVVLMSGLLIGAACMPAWSAANNPAARSAANNPAAPTASAEVMPANTAAPSLLAIRVLFGPSVDEPAPHKDQMNCKAGHLYSQHDIVGDPQACIMGRLTVIGGGVAP